MAAAGCLCLQGHQAPLHREGADVTSRGHLRAASPAGCATRPRPRRGAAAGAARRQHSQRLAAQQQQQPQQTAPAMLTGEALLAEAAAQVTEEHVALAHRLADAAAQVTLQYFRSPLTVESKADFSPVTEADRRAEAAMRDLIAGAFPHHGIFGEESGLHLGAGGSQADGRFLWVLDPIDGTKSFITGKPLFGTLIALLWEGVPILGIIDQPVLRERWLGVRGRPTTLNGQPVTTRACADVAGAYLYATTPHMFDGEAADAFARVRDAVRVPLYGCDCYAYGLLAAGHVDLVVEADLKVYDYMALVPVVEGAGGLITDWRGAPLRWAATASDQPAVGGAPPGEIVAAGDARVHRQALDLLAWA